MSDVKDDDYQRIANGVQNAVYDLLHAIHEHERPVLQLDAERGNGGPLISGCIGGLLEFYMDSDMPPETLLPAITGVLESLIPQKIMSRAAEALGATQEGNA